VEELEDAAVLAVGGEGAEHVDAHEDGGENVVEVVGDATGHGADGVEALGAEELGFEAFGFSDVGADDEDGFWLALVVAEERPSGLYEDGLVVFCGVPEFAGPFTLLNEGGPCGAEFGGFVGEDEGFPVAAEGFVGGPAVDGAGAVVPVFDRVVEVEHADGVAGNIEEGGLALELGLGGVLLGDVFEADDNEVAVIDGDARCRDAQQWFPVAGGGRDMRGELDAWVWGAGGEGFGDVVLHLAGAAAGITAGA